jgi:hypothetical protein
LTNACSDSLIIDDNTVMTPWTNNSELFVEMHLVGSES